jgi:hypothetical protein
MMMEFRGFLSSWDTVCVINLAHIDYVIALSKWILQVTQANWKIWQLYSPYLYSAVLIYTYFSSSIRLCRDVVEPRVDFTTGLCSGIISQTQFLRYLKSI